jgi:putative ABC transport system permease protein
MIPIQVARSLFSQPNINYSLSTMIQKAELLGPAIDNATLTMRKIRKLNPVEEDNFGISRSDDLVNKIASITGFLGVSAWLIGIITILGSSIALMNIMVVSVTERTREIGVRKALGAKKSAIAFQFFIETITVGQIGGLLGIILGILVGYAISTLLSLSEAPITSAIPDKTFLLLILIVTPFNPTSAKTASYNCTSSTSCHNDLEPTTSASH